MVNKNLQHAKVIFNKMEVQCKAEILNFSVAHVNTNLGVSVNMSIDINHELRNISVI
jgi:NADH/NAD ratio-sensing transcriptional regulator Rex